MVLFVCLFSGQLLVYSWTFWNIQAQITVDRCNSALFHIYRNHITSSHTCQQLCSFDSQLPKSCSLKHWQYVISLIKEQIILCIIFICMHMTRNYQSQLFSSIKLWKTIIAAWWFTFYLCHFNRHDSLEDSLDHSLKMALTPKKLYRQVSSLLRGSL